MARKKMRKFAEGDEIVVRGKRAPVVDEMTAFDLARFGGMGGIGNAAGAGMAGMGGGSGGGMGQRLAALTPPPVPARAPMAITPAVVRQPQSTLGNIVGARSPKGYGASFRLGFAEGGKVKAKAKPAKKMAKGGSTASKRADGCATKGKTKGRFV